MCNCDDNINSTEIFSGPQGPQGPVGDTPLISGTSNSNLTISTGVANFTTQAGITWSLGQRIRANNDDGTKVMEGVITAYSGTLLTLNIDYIKGSGSNSNWNLDICGELGQQGGTGPQGNQGNQGNAGVPAFTTLFSGSPISGDSYAIVVQNDSWMSVGQVIYIQGDGYFKVTSITNVTDLIIQDLGYPGNNTHFTPSSKISPGGLRGPTPFIYETVDGNGIPAQGNGAYSLLIRNSTNTGYTFITASDLKAYLNSI